MNIRELILNILTDLEKTGAYSHILIRDTLDKYDYLSPQEKAFFKRVTEGTLERRIQIDYVIDSFSKTPVKKMKPFIRNLLRMSVYQILFMDSVPDSAVCNEAVKLAEKHSFRNLKGFVNGVLRNIARGKNTIAWPEKEKDPVKYLSVRYSMPEWLTELWQKEYGAERTQRLLEAFLEIRPVTIRVRETLCAEERERLLGCIRENGTDLRAHPCLPYAFELTRVDGVKNIPGYEEGLFMVQDVSSMLCMEAAGIRQNDQIIDVCAAPGGKTSHAAIRLKGSGRVLARDLTEEKTALIRENVSRQGLTNVVTQCFDATVCDEGLEETADVLFADLPCSGLGILGKKRDIKYRVTPSALEELPVLQKRILDAVWRYVKPGGTLVYSTCTIHREENEKIAEWFRENYPFEPVDFSGRLPDLIKEESLKSGYLQLFPGEYGTDGFFIAVFRRKHDAENSGKAQNSGEAENRGGRVEENSG